MAFVDLHAGRNGLQILAGSVCAVIGAVWAYPIPPNTNWLAGLAGAVCGFIAGVFLTGTMMALTELIPATPDDLRPTPEQYAELNTRATAAMLQCVGASALTVVAIMAQKYTGVAHIFHFGLWLCCVHAEAERRAVLCSTCDERFGVHNPFQLTTHRCECCGSDFGSSDNEIKPTG